MNAKRLTMRARRLELARAAKQARDASVKKAATTRKKKRCGCRGRK